MVQPILLDYGAAGPLVAWIGDEPGQTNALKLLGHRGSFAATVHFLEPFDAAQLNDRKLIAAEARARIVEAMRNRLGIDPA